MAAKMRDLQTQTKNSYDWLKEEFWFVKCKNQFDGKFYVWGTPPSSLKDLDPAVQTPLTPAKAFAFYDCTDFSDEITLEALT